ncbi:hypothetical protein D3C81_694180 [compost metagenome]
MWEFLFNQIKHYTSAWTNINSPVPNDILQNYFLVIGCLVHAGQVVLFVMEAVIGVTAKTKQVEQHEDCFLIEG